MTFYYVAEWRALKPPSAHAAKLSAEQIVSVPLKFILSPSITRGTPASYISVLQCNILIKYGQSLTFSRRETSSTNGFSILLNPYLLTVTDLATINS